MRIYILLIIPILLSGCAYGRIGDKDAFFIGSGKFKSGDSEIESRIMPDQLPIQLDYEGD